MTRDCALLQLGVLRLRLLQDRNIRVAVFPQSEEVLVRRERSYPGGVCIGTLRSFGLQRVGAGQTQVSQSSGPAVPHDAVMVQDFLKLSCGRATLPSR